MPAPIPVGTSQSVFDASPSQYYTSVADGTADNKGSWVQMSASLSQAIVGVYVTTTIDSSVVYQGLFDIGVGAATSEIAIVSNILVHSGGIDDYMVSFFIPARIAAGLRVSLRLQTSNGSLTPLMHMYFITESGAAAGYYKHSTYGAVTADSGGTSVDPGASAGSKGAYSQLTAATTGVTHYLTTIFGMAENAAPTEAAWEVDFATGAATSEVVIIPDLVARADSTSKIITPDHYSLPRDIPDGVRLSCRAACSTNDATDRLIDVVTIGSG